MDIDFMKDQEVVDFLVSKKFTDLVDKKVEEFIKVEVLHWAGFEPESLSDCKFQYGGYEHSFRVAVGRFRTKQICVRDLTSQRALDDYATYVALEALQNITPLIAEILKQGGQPTTGRQKSITIEWLPWNEYDPLCNPEKLRPYYKYTIKITWQKEEDLSFLAAVKPNQGE